MLVAAAPASSDEWNYNAIAYAWLSGLSGTMGLEGTEGQPVDATFSQLAENLDFALAGHFEAVNPDIVFLTDIMYVNLGSTKQGEVANETVDVDFDMTQWIIELGGGYRVHEDFTLLLAGRYYILDTGATSTSEAGGNSGEVSQSWGDIFIGGRYNKLLKEKWIVSLRGDIGAGGSDFAWFGEAALGYRFTELISAIVAYRILDVDFEGDDGESYFKYDMTQSGIGLGLGFSF